MNRSGTRVRKILAVLLAAMMAFSVLPMSVFAAVDLNSGALPKDNLLVSKTDYQIAPGIEETHLVLNNADGTDQNHIHAMTVDVNNGTASLIASYKDQDATKFGLQTVTDQAAAAARNSVCRPLPIRRQPQKPNAALRSSAVSTAISLICRPVRPAVC